MAKSTITRDEVIAAAQTLTQRSQKPSVIAVREQLGARGSYTTIQRHLEDWRASGAGKVHEPALTIPEPVVQAMQAGLRQIWALADSEARREAAHVKEAADLLVEEAEKERNEARDEIVRLEKELTKEEAESARQRQRAELAEKNLAAAQALEADLRSRLSEDEGKRREIEVKLQAISASHEETERQLLAAARRNSELEVQGQKLAEALDKEKARVENERRRAETAMVEAAGAREEVKTSASVTQAATHRLQELERAAAAAAARETELRERLKAEEGRNAALGQQVSELAKSMAGHRPKGS